MNKNKFVKIGGILIVLLALAALVGSTLTFAQDEDPDTVTVPEDGSEADATSGFGRFGDRGPRGGHHGGLIDREAARELLAEELGVTVEDLDAAHDAVMEAVQTEDGRPDRDEVKALLAEQLGVTVEELKAAEDAVQEAMLAQLVADGTITQEQLDEMLAMQELRELGKEIFSRDDAQAVIAEQLGLTVEELAAAHDEGTRLSDLAEQQGVDLETVMTAVSDARTAAIEAAVADGTITQDQADILLSHDGPGFGGRGHGGHGGRGGHGGPGGGGFGPGSTDGTNGTSTSADLDA
ncbi:MAG: hypothetical protein H6654_06825 [Ardenticatenaceae bacterium]|nr:hypothetical protein [Anaerolineales bacterium]MCB8940237.1 hypothetical protein [Ardenticatenaceae bacterium]MCB8973252.1 hypothetical protein [Ardenticatenaceae bacterium]